MTEIKEFVAVAGAIITSSVFVFNWRANRFRTKLKDDLVILKQYREELVAQGLTIDLIKDNEHYIALQSSINRKIVRAYIYRGTDFSDLAISVACLLLSGFIWYFYPQEQPRLRLGLLTLFAALATVFVIKSVHNRKEPHSS